MRPIDSRYRDLGRAQDGIHTPTKFVIKQHDFDLFGVVDNKRLLRGKFSGTPTETLTVEFGDGILDHIADAIGIDVEDDLNAMSRFVQGQWRGHAEPPGTSTIGNFGEVLTYVHLLSQGKRPLRVVSHRVGEDQDKDEVGDFPRPDYLIEEGTQMGLCRGENLVRFRLSRFGTSRNWTE